MEPDAEPRTLETGVTGQKDFFAFKKTIEYIYHTLLNCVGNCISWIIKLVCISQQDKVLIRKTQRELTPHAVEKEAVIPRHPELIPVAHALVNRGVIDGIVDLL